MRGWMTSCFTKVVDAIFYVVGEVNQPLHIIWRCGNIWDKLRLLFDVFAIFIPGGLILLFSSKAIFHLIKPFLGELMSRDTVISLSLIPGGVLSLAYVWLFYSFFEWLDRFRSDARRRQFPPSAYIFFMR